MSEQNYTSLELSKWLHENGCELESEYLWDEPFKPRPKLRSYREVVDEVVAKEKVKMGSGGGHCIPAYDILNDICVKYAKEFFGEQEAYLDFRLTESARILCIISRVGKREAEDYIKQHCLFNPKNK